MTSGLRVSFICAAGLLLCTEAGASPASVSSSAAVSVEFGPDETEVVVAADAPKTVLFAAEEMTNFLSRVFDSPVPIVTSATPGRKGIYLGDSDLSRKAGIDVSAMKRDAFAIVCEKGRVFIAGRDDPNADTRRAIYSPHTGVWAQLHEHATLFGVYEFLERYAGVRMYFPGELGTLVPFKAAVIVPEGRLDVAPALLERNYSAYSDGIWYEGEDREKTLLAARKLNYTRNRMQTLYIPCCHGTRGFDVQRRFSKEHPEYMALFKKKGELVRDLDPDEKAHHPGQLCHSSAVYDEFFEDIRSYARGDGPEVRGVRPAAGAEWPRMTFRKPWVDIMPQDGYVECQCEKCQAAYDKGRRQYATGLIWGRTVGLANRLRKEGVDIRITQMAYHPYRDVPDVEIPDNVDVMVAETGPWSATNPAELRREQDEIRAWSRKLGRPVWIWVYPNKWGSRFVPDVPNGTPRAWASYVKAVAPSIFGVFAECENDRALYNSLCYYVLGKVCWNPDVDVEAILDEFFVRMFREAAEPMAEFFGDIESRWLNGVRGKSVDTPLGPERQMPSEYELFTRVYGPGTMAKWDALLRKAAGLVPADSPEARRIALFRREFYDPLAARVEAYGKSVSVEAEVARRAEGGRTNLLVNADFAAPPSGGSKRHFGYYANQERGQGWRGGWICQEEDVPFVSIVDGVPPGAHGRAFRMSVSGEPRTVRAENHFCPSGGRFEPGRKYRISFFVRLQGVESRGKGGGVGVRVWHDRNEWFPRNRMTGTTDWIHQEYFFTAGPKSADFTSQFVIYLWNATGTVEYADVRIEPCGEAAAPEGG